MLFMPEHYAHGAHGAHSSFVIFVKLFVAHQITVAFIDALPVHYLNQYSDYVSCRKSTAMNDKGRYEILGAQELIFDSLVFLWNFFSNGIINS